MKITTTIAILWMSLTALAQGSFDPAVGQSGSLAIYRDSSIIKSWASSCEVIRGYKDIADKSAGRVNAGKAEYAIGYSNPGTVSLGDSGIATLSFEGWVNNGPGPDFCVFENSFNDSFLELAFVEVSSDGQNFVRFPAISEVDPLVQKGSFDLIDPTQINNLAGKYRGQYGTPFDLEELKNEANLNVDSIRYIRVVDVIGSIDSTIATFDSKGNPVNDPYPTPFETGGNYTGGFDLDAVGLIHYEGEIFTSTNPVEETAAIRLYPNPVSHSLYVEHLPAQSLIELYAPDGKKMMGEFFQEQGELDLSSLPTGLYMLQIHTNSFHSTHRIIKQ